MTNYNDKPKTHDDPDLSVLTEYQDIACTFAIYPAGKFGVIYPALGLAGETGEVCEKVKKSIRGDREIDRKEMTRELGDVLWYLANLADDLGIALEDVARANLEKLRSRRDRGVLRGDGDNR